MTYQGVSWGEHVDGYEHVDFSVMPDVDGKVYEFYGANAYDAFLIDRSGRLVTRFVEVYDNAQFPAIRTKLRDLHAE